MISKSELMVSLKMGLSELKTEVVKGFSSNPKFKSPAQRFEIQSEKEKVDVTLWQNGEILCTKTFALDQMF
jgi:hypothetical protein